MSKIDKYYDTLPWIEKYRPQNLNEIISHAHITDTLKKFINNNSLPHLLFYGPPGTGKTSVIMSCAKELYGPDYNLMVLEINASEERGIEVIRTRVHQFVSTKNIFFGNMKNTFKLVILDEADAMTGDAQAILRKVIEKYTYNTRFCLICNYVKKINIALQSRCTLFRFSPLKQIYIRKKIAEIIDKENVNITDLGISTIIKRANGDMRKVLNILQSTSMAYDVVTDVEVNNCTSYPTQNNMIIIFESLICDTFKNSLNLIDTIKANEGYSLNDIIIELHEEIIKLIMKDKNTFVMIKNKKINKLNLAKILELMRDIEYNLTICTSELLQTSAIVGIFKLVKHNGTNISQMF
jgi:replication factor C subunit 3/5